MSVCSRCGNTIPQWAQGGCPTCTHIEKEHKRYGDRRQGRQIQQGRQPNSPPHARLSPKQNRKLPDPCTMGLLPCLCGFNRLLQDMYGRKMRISEILLDLGMTQNQITICRKDETWLLKFMGRLEHELQSMLCGTDIDNDPCILMEYYLAGCSEEKIAMEFRSTPLKIRELLDRYLAYLRSADGHIAFEKIVLKCVEG